MIAWDKIRTILFDLDGLMVDSEPHSLTSWQVVLTARKVDLEPAVIDRMFGLRHIEAARMLVSVYRLAEDPSVLAREKEEYQIAHLHGQIAPMPGLCPLLEELNAVDSEGRWPVVGHDVT